MDKKQYDNPLRRQCQSLAALCADQIAGVRQGLEVISAQELQSVRNVLVTGCGDSYLAARACLPAFRQFNRAFGTGFEAPRCIDLARTYEITAQNTPATLVVCISASGGPARVREALLRAKAQGCRTMLITNNPQSPGAQAADFPLVVHTPDFPESSPGLRNYYASLVGLYGLAAKLGEARGLSPVGTLDRLFDAISAFTADFGRAFPGLDDTAWALAQRWKDFAAYEAVGDNIDFSTASFIAAKFVEVTGDVAPTVDSEDWCHVNYFAHDAGRVGTIVVSNVRENNRSRIAETVFQAAGVGRPVLLITNGTAQDYNLKPDSGVTVCTLPEPPEGYPFLMPLLGYLPGALLAAYVAALRGDPYFRGEDSPQKRSPVGSSIGTSSIEVPQEG